MSQCTRCVCPLGADEKVKENERVEALRERAQIIVELERTQPGSHQYHKYMHIAEAADSSEPVAQEWEGITGRMKQVLEVQDRRTEEKIDDSKIEVESKIDEVKAEVNAKVEKLQTQMRESKDEVKAQIQEIKDILTAMANKVN